VSTTLPTLTGTRSSFH